MSPYPDKENEEAPEFIDKDAEEKKQREVIKERRMNLSEKMSAGPNYEVLNMSQIAPNPLMYQMGFPPPVPPMSPPMSAIEAMQAPQQQLFVTDDLLVQEIRRILDYADLATLTKKKVRQDLSTIFQTDLSSRKAFINMQIDKILAEEI
jgi:hypothetical protein